jgi:hypothetical protein
VSFAAFFSRHQIQAHLAADSYLRFIMAIFHSVCIVAFTHLAAAAGECRRRRAQNIAAAAAAATAAVAAAATAAVAAAAAAGRRQ